LDVGIAEHPKGRVTGAALSGREARGDYRKFWFIEQNQEKPRARIKGAKMG
jgi:hypothetical protein